MKSPSTFLFFPFCHSLSLYPPLSLPLDLKLSKPLSLFLSPPLYLSHPSAIPVYLPTLLITLSPSHTFSSISPFLSISPPSISPISTFNLHILLNVLSLTLSNSVGHSPSRSSLPLLSTHLPFFDSPSLFLPLPLSLSVYLTLYPSLSVCLTPPIKGPDLINSIKY